MEKLEINKKSLDAVVQLSEGDLRKTANLLQSAAAVRKKLDTNLIYKVAAKAQPEEMEEILKLAFSNKFIQAREKLLGLMVKKGLSGEDVVKTLHSMIPGLKLDEKTRAILLDKLGEYEFRIVEGANDHIQVSALLAQLALLGSKKK